MTHPMVTALPVGVPITIPSAPPQLPQVVDGPVVGVPWLDGPVVGASVEPSWVPIVSVDEALTEALESMRNQMPWLFWRVPGGHGPTPQAHGTEMSSVRSYMYGRPYSANRPVVSEPASGSPGGSTSSSSSSRSSTSEFELATLQCFEHGATFEGDAASPKLEQLLANMREMGYVEFSRDDARIALEEYGHDRHGHDRPVNKIVQMILDRPMSS